MIVGGMAFLLSHAFEAFGWASFDPGGTHRPWFLNAGPAVLFTAAWLLAAAAIECAVAAGDRHDAIVRGANVALGAFVAMVIVLVAVGPGTLFPIALAIGAAVAAMSSLAGALIGWRIRRKPRASGG